MNNSNLNLIPLQRATLCLDCEVITPAQKSCLACDSTKVDWDLAFCVRHAGQSLPDLLLLDLGMPVLDGFGVIRKIRENPCWAQLRVLAVTAYAMHGDRDKIIRSGFDGYLSKPINSALLLEELAHLLNKTDGHEAINPSR